MLKEKLFRLYYRKVFPYIERFRGTTKLLKILEWFWLKDYISETQKGFKTDFDGVEIKTCRWEDLSDIYREEHLENYTKNFTIEEGDIIFDLGAFHGIFAIYAARKAGESGKVIAVEPDKENRDRLQENIKLNNLENVEVLSKPIWDSEKIISFSEKGGMESQVSEKGRTEKKALTIDSLAKKYDFPDFIKMDIEGAEIEALKGSDKVLEKGASLAIKSYHIRNSQETSEWIEEYFEDTEYIVSTLNKFPREKTTFIWKKNRVEL